MAYTWPLPENPLLRSGLAMAGANTWLRGGSPPAEAEDGLLTAEDVSGLDLLDTELAVLSACQTGLGDVRTGEGVFGLQRAFHLGGGRNVIASLWKVDDDATVALMALFYHELWVNERPPLEALRQAQLALYRHPGEARTLARARGPDFDKTVKRVVQPPPPLRPPSAVAMVSAVAIGRLRFGAQVDGADRVGVDPRRLEGFDVGQPIDDPTADLQVSRPAPLPAPLFERAWRNEPTLRQMLLVKMLHAPVLSCVMRARPIRRAQSRGRTWTFWVD